VLHVADMQRSLRFYTLLGFDTIDTQGEDGRVHWARLHCEGGALMLLLAEEPSPSGAHGLMLYMYTPDLESLREHLLANGLEVSTIRHPERRSDAPGPRRQRRAGRTLGKSRTRGLGAASGRAARLAVISLPVRQQAPRRSAAGRHCRTRC
jgi:catechol 2,3-dioxygenase-like lactoylglutathione lyase family enzyme